MVGEILLLKLFLSLLEDPDAGFTKKGRKSAKISTNKFIGRKTNLTPGIQMINQGIREKK